MSKSDTAMGSFGSPSEGRITTGIEECQRSGVFVNGTSEDIIIKSAGFQIAVESGKTATIPIGSDIDYKATGEGTVLWSATSDVLPAQVTTAPKVMNYGESEPPISVVTVSGTERIKLSTGNYTKLVFVFESKEALPI